MAMNREKRRSESGATDDLDEKVVFVNRCAKTVKGGDPPRREGRPG